MPPVSSKVWRLPQAVADYGSADRSPAFVRGSPGDPPGFGGTLEHPQHGCRQGNHTRTRLGVPDPQLARRAVHVIPAQRQNLALPASGQHQQADRRNRQQPHRTVRLDGADILYQRW